MICCQVALAPRADPLKIGVRALMVKSVIEANEPVTPLVMMSAFLVPSGSPFEAFAFEPRPWLVAAFDARFSGWD